MYETHVLRSNNLFRLVCTTGMIISLLCVGGLGVTGEKDELGDKVFTRGIGIGIVCFACVKFLTCPALLVPC